MPLLLTPSKHVTVFLWRHPNLPALTAPKPQIPAQWLRLERVKNKLSRYSFFLRGLRPTSSWFAQSHMMFLMTLP